MTDNNTETDDSTEEQTDDYASAHDKEFDWFRVISTPTEKTAAGPVTEKLTVDTREGTVVAEPGDYLMLEEDGNVYPISGEKFGEYYEEQTETDDSQTWVDCPECGVGIGEYPENDACQWPTYCPYCGDWIGLSPERYEQLMNDGPADFPTNELETNSDTGRDWVGLARHYATSFLMFALLGLAVLNFIDVMRIMWEWYDE